MTAKKFSWLSKIGTKRTDTIAKGVKKLGKFLGAQLRHPAVGTFLRDEAGIAASTGFNPETAAPLMGARAAQEGVNILGRTAHHYLK